MKSYKHIPDDHPNKRFKSFIPGSPEEVKSKLERIRQAKQKIDSETGQLNLEQDKEYEKSGTYCIDASVKAAANIKKEIEPLYREIIQYYWQDDKDHAMILDGIKITIEFLNPHLTDNDAFAEEIKKLEKCIDRCKRITSPSYREMAALLAQEIRTIHIPWMTYEHVRLFDLKTKIESAEYIPVKKADLEEDVTEEVLADKMQQLDKLVTLDEQNIANIEDALASPEMLPYQNTLYQLKASAYEYLGDHLFYRYDLMDEGDDKEQNKEQIKKQILLLSRIMKTYEKVYEHTNDNIIFYSLLNASYLRAEKYQKAGDNKSYKREIKQIITDMDEIKKTFEIDFASDLVSENPEHMEGINYILNCCEKLYKAGSVLYKNKAVKLLTILDENIHQVKDPQTKNDLIGWLIYYLPVFGMPGYVDKTNIRFTMASEGEVNFVDKRHEQAKTAIAQLCAGELGNSRLYDHQKEAIIKLNSLFNNDIFSGFYNLPTGSGKTILMIIIALRIRMPTLIIVPQTNLVDQTIAQLREWGGPLLDITRFDGRRKKIKTMQIGDICVSSYQMLTTGLSNENQKDNIKYQQIIKRLNSYGLILFDEAHRALSKNRQKIYELTPHAIKLGFTATPDFNNKRAIGDLSSLPELFGQCIYAISLVEAIDRQILCPVKNIIVEVPSIDFNKINVNTKKASFSNRNDAADYTDAELYQFLTEHEQIQIPVDLYANGIDTATNERLFGKITIIFCAGVEHANILSYAFNEKFKEIYPDGISACVVGNTRPTERDRIFKLHRERKIPVLIGCGVFGEGYDNPPDELIFNIRPTRSALLAKQRGGRGLRLFAGHEIYLVKLLPDNLQMKKAFVVEQQSGMIWQFDECGNKKVVLENFCLSEISDDLEAEDNIKSIKKIPGYAQLVALDEKIRSSENASLILKPKKYVIVCDWSYGIEQVFFRDFLQGDFTAGLIEKDELSFDPNQKPHDTSALHYKVHWDGSNPAIASKNKANTNRETTQHRETTQQIVSQEVVPSNFGFFANQNFSQSTQPPLQQQLGESQLQQPAVVVQPFNNFQPGLQQPFNNFQPGLQQPFNFQPGLQQPFNFQPVVQLYNFQPGVQLYNFQPGVQLFNLQPDVQPFNFQPDVQPYNNLQPFVQQPYDAQLYNLQPTHHWQQIYPQLLIQNNNQYQAAPGPQYYTTNTGPTMFARTNQQPHLSDQGGMYNTISQNPK